MKRALLLLPTLALALAATPALAQEAAADAEEAPRYPPPSVRPKLIAGGLAVTAIAYGVGFVAATSWPDAPGASSLKIPVAGPWIAIAQNKCGIPNETDCSGSIWLRGLLTGLGGLAQLGGLGLVAEGIFMKTQAPAPKPDESATAIVVHPFPIVTSHSTGIGVVGTF
ncbi:hypothetical protein [Polyangium aurulentum]|uniref:hypothetical protein n=1 Tax=Polyangium aurulentum TaxID=2567896 RepID=UPI0010AECD03|nr:hypothetical protein [Polyangium aurulentum]UQA62298.1 hypothetical protein E8A73_018250 [Polyangium aurulentum]